VKVAALYDIHAMLTPLEAVLADVEREGVDAIVLGGDLVAGPQPEETLALLRALPGTVHWIRGNHERLLGDEAALLADGWPLATWAATQHTEEERDFLVCLPETVELELPLGRVLFCHATPRSDEEIVTPITPEERLAAIVAGIEADVVVAGHTHMQDDRRAGGVRWINAGSVGMPFDGRAGRAFWALLGESVELRATPFDVEATIAAVEATRADGVEDLVDQLRAQPTRADASEHFERLAVGGG
jgi:putative phosphoesterase